MIELGVKMTLAYLLGGIMGGDVMRRVRGGDDLRAAGSGNVGATNALRTRGASFALGVLVIDIAKGVIAVLVLAVLPWPVPGAATGDLHSALPYTCAVAVVLGHCYPVFERFRGGKGVATLAGVFGAAMPAALPWIIGAFVLAVMLTGRVAVASIAGSLVAWLFVGGFGAGLLSQAGAFTSAMLLLVLFKHRANIGRLMAGTEPRFERARVLGRWLDRATRA